MTVLARPNHPVRLAGVFVLGVLAFGLVAAAAGAVLYIIDNERSSGAPPAVANGVNVDLPPGLALLHRVDSVAEWSDALGFKPVMADMLPEGVVDQPLLYVQQPDKAGNVAGRVRYGRDDGAPGVELIEQPGTPASDLTMRLVESAGTRVHIQALACGSLAIHVQVFFQEDAGGELPGVPVTEAVAQAVVASLRDQCGTSSP